MSRALRTQKRGPERPPNALRGTVPHRSGMPLPEVPDGGCGSVPHPASAGRRRHAGARVGIAKAALPGPAARRAQVGDAVLDRGRSEGAVLVGRVLGADFGQLVERAAGPPVAHLLDLAQRADAGLQPRGSLPGVTSDSCVNVGPRSGNALGDRGQGRAFLAVVGFGLGARPPSGKKATFANAAVPGEAAVEVEAPAAGALVLVDRHAALYASTSAGSKRTAPRPTPIR